MDFKNIHIGRIIQKRVEETEIDILRICKFLNCTEDEVEKMYSSESIDSYMILRWSKLMQYDFFRIYSQHLILFCAGTRDKKNNSTSLPVFRKNTYTKEIIDFILESIRCGIKTKQEVMEDYEIPKTTLYKWISKYEK